MATVDEYHSLILRAVAELQDNTHDTRLALYERARDSLNEQLATANSSSRTTVNQRRSLENAIRRVENKEQKRSLRANRVDFIWSSAGLEKWLMYQVRDLAKVLALLFGVGVAMLAVFRRGGFISNDSIIKYIHDLLERFGGMP
jgi:hypothetical protein